MRLGLPIDCTIGRDCFIQNHVDTDPGPGFRDHACGTLGYNGDTGTDFRLPSFAEMRAGVAVLAAADGVVKATRDGMPDTGRPAEGPAALEGRTAGNAVILDHGGGWETQYSHLRQGSVRVKRGDTVEAGDVLGLVGYSGNTQFPHVEMIVRRDGTVIDPFLGPAGFKGCDGPREPLWRADVAGSLAYTPTGLLQAGFAAERPADDRIRDGAHRDAELPADTPTLVFWMELFGLGAGDSLAVQVEGPGGRRVFAHSMTIDRNSAARILSAPVRRPAEGYRPGAYEGRVDIIRDGETVVSGRRTVTLR